MIGVDRYKMQIEITQDDIESLTLFANQASIIISNARYLKALNDQKKLSENIVHSSINGTIVSDLEGHIRIINPKAKEIFGLSNDAAKYILLQDIIKIIDDKWGELIKELSNNNHIPNFELLVDRNDGKRLLLDITIFAVFNENDRIENLVTNVVDITTKKKLEEYWLRLEKFAALGGIASGIAHEIRNPLAAIYTTIQNLEKEYNKNSSQYAILQSVLNEIDGAERLIRQMLNLSRPSPLLMIDTEICEVLLSTVTLVQQQASAKNIVIRTKFKNKKIKTRLDPDRMKQVFLNLIINAIEAIENKGQILISARKEKSEKVGHNWIVIEIKDNGIGIPQCDIGKIFDPFFSTKAVGTGLGLAVSHKIVQDHGGRIEVESIEHKETTFYINLPMNK
jgi:PAS domain S-box-containing protein